ncbi:hypothetical protein [Polyangium aurulentum]|uniref:hypothetical protein n=1 Tax=Polyangium aurulentum TaxID=2567896 RepID=UPI0010AEB354|nr:hypothetical protein [Polyangium aurulentum]UQA57691.1 hypothetical protein E8A73_041490 [Polyangium aurulentum]
MLRSILVLALVLGACGGGTSGGHAGATPASPDPAAKPPTATQSPPPAALVPRSPSAPPPPSSPEVTPPAPAPAPADEGAGFPPPAFAPPFARTAKPGDGVYSPITEGAAGGLLARTLVHPHPVKPHPYVAIVAVDLRRVSLGMAAGTEEPVSKSVPAERRTGLVPQADMPGLIAVFNGGFLTQHGGWGMMVEGDTFVPPRDEGCTVARLDDGSVRIGAWKTLAPLSARMRAYRQTPPCLFEGGKPHPSLPNEDTARLWGAAVGGDREIRRTALGLDASGKILFFGIGEWIWARDLAAAMRAAGAVDVAELDINWSYTRFLLYDRPVPPSPPEVVSTLIPKVEYTRGGYVQKPAPRDFFYLTRRR